MDSDEDYVPEEDELEESEDIEDGVLEDLQDVDDEAEYLTSQQTGRYKAFSDEGVP